jgi:hypothetical protein
MLRLAALLGPTFRLQDVAALLRVTSGELLNAADEALATGIVANRGTGWCSAHRRCGNRSSIPSRPR